MLLQFMGNLTEDTFLTDKVFCQCRTVSHIIIAYLVLVVDKFIKPVKPSLYDGFHFIADRRALHFLYHAAFCVDFPQGHFTVYFKRQLIIGYFQLFFILHAQSFFHFLQIHRAVEPAASIPLDLVVTVRLGIV